MACSCYSMTARTFRVLKVEGALHAVRADREEPHCDGGWRTVLYLVAAGDISADTAIAAYLAANSPAPSESPPTPDRKDPDA